MGHIVPDRFFWALPPPEEGEEGEGVMPEPEPEDPKGKTSPRRVH
jgi:hydroxymethylpyrimidine/phosphomethylpyrimidine kinase